MGDYKLERMRETEALITGGMGFLGSNLAHELVGMGMKVTLYDAFLEPYGANYANLSGINDKVAIVKGDTRDFDALCAQVKEKDYIFNYAAQVSHGLSMEQPFLDIDINCRGNMCLLEACRKFNDSAKIVYAGTRGQTGEAQYLPVDERHPDNPPDINGIDKLAAEKYHLLYHKVYGLKTTSLRFNNTYGPRHQMKHGQYGVLNYFIRQAMLGETIKVFGDGSQLRDYTYVDDATAAAILAAQKKQSTGNYYLLGSGEQITFLDMVKAVISAVGSGRYGTEPFPPTRKAIDVRKFVVTYKKIQADLGWSPKTTLKEGLAKTVDFYREHLGEYT